MEIETTPQAQFMREIVDPSHVGETRRAALEYATASGMDENDRGKIAILVTELATNLLKHARHGKILFEPVRNKAEFGLRFLSVDKGPGIRNVSEALRDGFSTYGSSGNGLGAVRRLATVFDLYSAPELGTCVLAEFWPHRAADAIPPLSTGVISLPIRGEHVCGDGWGRRATAEGAMFLVVDGLGHGELAAEAAREAERIFARSHTSSAVDIMRDCHDALKKTRGAAAAIATISKDKGTLVFVGVGNISATVIDGHSRRGIASHNGTLGHQLHKIQEFTVPWNDTSTLIMHSDGLGSRWDLKNYPGLTGKEPSIIAAMLYRDFFRERDDVTVMAVKNRQ